MTTAWTASREVIGWWKRTLKYYHKKISILTSCPDKFPQTNYLAAMEFIAFVTSLEGQKLIAGESFHLLQKKKVDVILVHAPEAEKKAVQEGWATRRTLLGYNEFFLVGPPGDPAETSGAASAKEAFRRIASQKALFFSRGDDSGTHRKELAIWREAGIQAAGEWYRVTRNFMGASLFTANRKKT